MNLANKITVIRIILVPVFALFMTPTPEWIANKHEMFVFLNRYGLYIAAFIFIVASITDKIDGYIARHYNQVTKLGKLLDPLADKLLVSTALIFLVERNQVAAWIAIIIIFREFTVTGLRIMAAKKNTILAADQLGKIKMVFQVVAITLALLQNYPVNLVIDFPFDKVIMLIAAVITVYSGINYMVKNKEVILD